MFNAIELYRASNWLYQRRIPLLPQVFRFFIFIIYNSVIPYEAIIGRGTYLSYGGVGVIIHKRTVLGENVIIGSNVTIGGKSGSKEVPKIGNYVYIATGAKILGNVKIGDYAVIGANAVVTKDVPAKAVVAGVPAKIISYKGGPNYYEVL